MPGFHAHAAQRGGVRLAKVHARADGHAADAHGDVSLRVRAAVVVGRAARGQIAWDITAQPLRPFEAGPV